VASYVETFVGPGEKVQYLGRISIYVILPALICGGLSSLVGAVLAATVGAVIGIALLALGVIWLVSGLIKRSSTELAVTNRRIIAKFGLIRRSTIELNLSKVESIRVEQSIMGRLFGFGSVIVTGTGSTMDPISYVADPIKFRQAIEAAVDAAQKA